MCAEGTRQIRKPVAGVGVELNCAVPGEGFNTGEPETAARRRRQRVVRVVATMVIPIATKGRAGDRPVGRDPTVKLGSASTLADPTSLCGTGHGGGYTPLACATETPDHKTRASSKPPIAGTGRAIPPLTCPPRSVTPTTDGTTRLSIRARGGIRQTTAPFNMLDPVQIMRAR